MLAIARARGGGAAQVAAAPAREDAGMAVCSWRLRSAEARLGEAQ